MENAQKPVMIRPRVIHGPHRIRLSGIIPGQPLPEAQVHPMVTSAEIEIAGETIEVPVEVILLDEPK